MILFYLIDWHIMSQQQGGVKSDTAGAWIHFCEVSSEGIEHSWK